MMFVQDIDENETIHSRGFPEISYPRYHQNLLAPVSRLDAQEFVAAFEGCF